MARIIIDNLQNLILRGPLDLVSRDGLIERGVEILLGQRQHLARAPHQQTPGLVVPSAIRTLETKEMYKGEIKADNDQTKP